MPVSRLVIRLGIPRSTWYYWKRAHERGRPVRRWPAPVVEESLPVAGDYARRYSAWGHRKIWAMMRADGVKVSASSVLRALRRLDLVLPARYQAERRHLAQARKSAFAEVPRRRNRVWQMDFTEYETLAGGTWRVCCVVDYATKCALAAPVTGTGTARDAVAALRAAIESAEEFLGHGLAHDCVDKETGEIAPLRIVTDNGSPFKSDAFLKFFRERPFLEHIRTRHYAPQTNGVVERFNQSLKYEHLYRLEINQAWELAEEVEAFLQLYNEVRPHEAIGFRRPLEIYRLDPHLFSEESVQET
jgi:putative transposase